MWISSNRNWSITNGKRRVTNREISISPGAAVSDFHAGVPKRQSAVGFAISAWLQTPFAVIRNGSPRDIAIMTLLNKLVGRHARLYTAFNSIPVVHVSRIRYYVNSLPFHVLWELINFWHGRRIVRWLWSTRFSTKESFRYVGRIVQVLMKYLYEICWAVEVIYPTSTGVRCVLTLFKVLSLFFFFI